MQELEKILEEIDQEVKEYMEIDFGDEYNAGIKDMAKMAKKIIRKYMNDGWISVDERMPEEHEEGTDIYDKNTLAVMDTEYHMVSNLVNVTVYDYENEKYFVGADCTFDGEWCNFGLVTGNYEVIAWRPLPEPYRPERQKEGAQQNES